MKTPRCFAWLLVLLGAAVWPACAAAQARPALSEQDWLEELPVVLSVSRLAQPQNEAPGAVTVVDREMIRQSGARHLVDLLRLVPGFQVAPIANGAPAAVYHGLAQDYPRHMQVLVDGRSQYSPFFIGGVNWNLVPVAVDDIERIEAVRGSNSAAYGSNAFLGVVNIVTRPAADTRGAAAEVRTGSGGIEDRRLRLGVGGDNLALRLTAETQQDDGLDNFRDGIRRRLVDLRADWRLGLRDELQLQAGEMATTAQMGRGGAADPLRSQAQRHRFLAVGWRRALGDGEDLAIRFYRAEEEAADAFSFRLYDSYSPANAAVLAFLGVANHVVPVDYGFRSVRNHIDATHTVRPSPDTRLAWGGELRTDTVASTAYYGRADAVALAVGRLFGSLEWRPAPSWVANVGATLENDSNSKTTFAPRLALNWHAARGQTLRAGVSRAYRTPSLFETRANYAFAAADGTVLERKAFASGRLAPEQVISRELGWLGEFHSLGVTADVRAFDERVTDRIVAIPSLLAAPHCEDLWMARGLCGQADDLYNAQDVNIRGLEHQWRWQPTAATRVILNQSFIRIQANAYPLPAGVAGEYDVNKDAIQAARSAPTHTTTLMLMQRLPGGFQLAATWHSVGAMKWTNNTEAAGYRRLDWRLAYPFRFGGERGELAFTVFSDGAPHAEHAAREVVSRRGFASLRLEF